MKDEMRESIKYVICNSYNDGCNGTDCKDCLKSEYAKVIDFKIFKLLTLFDKHKKEYALGIVGDNEKRCSDGDVCAVARNLLRIEQREKIKGGK